MAKFEVGYGSELLESMRATIAKAIQSSFTWYPTMVGHLSSKNKAEKCDRRDFDWEVGVTKPFLKLIGLWPGGSHQTWCFLVNLMMQSYLFATFLISIILEPSISRKIDKIFVLTGILVTITDISVFRAQWHNIELMMLHIRQNWEEWVDLSTNIQKIMVSYGAQKRRITMYIYSAFSVSLICFCSQPIILHLVFPSQIPLQQPNDPWYPFNATVSPVFEITYIINCIFSCSSAVIFASIDCCIIWLIFHCCGQLEILASVMSQYKGIHHHNISDSTDDDKRVMKDCSCLDCIVHDHLKIFKIISLFDDAFHVIMVARMIICTVHFICIGYTIIKLKDDGNFVFLMVHILFLFTMNSSFFIYCWLGDTLKEKSIDIAHIAFHQQICGEGIARKDLIMIIRQAQMKPCRITAGKFFVMSLELFKEYVLKSMSYLSVLVALRVNDRS